jgi:hypothetical protein
MISVSETRLMAYKAMATFGPRRQAFGSPVSTDGSLNGGHAPHPVRLAIVPRWLAWQTKTRCFRKSVAATPRRGKRRVAH